MFAGHYAAGDPLGTKESLTALDRATIAAHHRRLAVGANVVFSIYGNVDPRAATESLGKLLKERPLAANGAPVSNLPPAAEPQRPAPLSVSFHAGRGAALAMGWRGPGLDTRAVDEAPLAVLAALLVGGGHGGRINRALGAFGEQTRMSASVERYAGRGMLALHGRVDETLVDAVQQAVRDQIKQLAAALQAPANDPQALPPAELATAKAICLTAAALAQEDVPGSAARHAISLLTGGDLALDADLLKRMSAVGIEDLRKAMQAWLGAEPLVVVLRPRRDGEPGASREPAPPQPLPALPQPAPPQPAPPQPASAPSATMVVGEPAAARPAVASAAAPSSAPPAANDGPAGSTARPTPSQNPR